MRHEVVVRRTQFELKKAESSSIPLQSIYDTDVTITTIRQTKNIWEAIRILNQLILQTVIFPDGDQIDQKRRKITWWEKPEH